MAKHKRLKSIGDYLFDKGEMIEQMFSSIPIVEIRNMVPMKLQGMPLHELKAECLVELLGISDREILNIVEGKEKNVPSSDSETEDVFVISDDEGKIPVRRIKKEKKHNSRKIKRERVLSTKDSDSIQSPEPSTSKKKRKSKEMAELASKKKKKLEGDPVSNPSSSKDASKVPASRKKKKNKKDEKKKEPSKNNEEDVVILDDDSDKEVEHEQKSLLDLLELEMRARAIRSLLKKEEAVQAQKVLSEYKDEPDDLIPIEIEPPHIELLSDSDEEGGTNITQHGLGESMSSEEIKGGSKCSDSSQSVEARVQCSIPLSDPSNRDTNSTFCTEKNETCLDERGIIIESEGKSANCGSPRSSQIVTKDLKDSDEEGLICSNSEHHDLIQSVVNTDAKAVELADSSGTVLPLASRSEDSTNTCVSESTTGAKDIEPIASSTTCLGVEKTIDADHFLVIDEPSTAGGSKIEKISSKMENPTLHDGELERITEPGCSLTLQEELKPVTDSVSIGVNREAVNDNSVPLFVPIDENGASGEERTESSGACLALESVNPHYEDLQFDEEILDNNLSKKPSVATIFQSENSPLSVNESPPIISVDQFAPVIIANSHSENCERGPYAVQSSSKQMSDNGAPDTENERSHIAKRSNQSSTSVSPRLPKGGMTSEELPQMECISRFVQNNSRKESSSKVDEEVETLEPDEETSSLSISKHSLGSLSVSISDRAILNENTQNNPGSELIKEQEPRSPPANKTSKHVGTRESCETQSVGFGGIIDEAALHLKMGTEVSSVQNKLEEDPSLGTPAFSPVSVDCQTTKDRAVEDFSSICAEPTMSARSSCVTESSTDVDGLNKEHAATFGQPPMVKTGVSDISPFISSDSDANVNNSTPKTSCIEEGDNKSLCSFVTGSIKSSNEPLRDASLLDNKSLTAVPVVHDDSIGCLNSSLNVAEVIDITNGESLEDSEVAFIDESRVDSDSSDESVIEISGKAASILEQMNAILNDDDLGGSNVSKFCLPSPKAADVFIVNSDDSEQETDGDGGPSKQKGQNTVLVVSDLEDTGEGSQETTDSDDDDDDDDDYDGSDEVVSDSESLCSVDSCVIVVPPTDDCVIVRDAEPSINSFPVVIEEVESSDSDDCAIVPLSLPNDPVSDKFGEKVKDISAIEESSLNHVKTCHIAPEKDSVMVTIVIEDDDGEEEVQLLTQEVPAEILELNDDDEVKSNWTARWLESDNVKRVVKTSKILANVRKQMKMKFKKVEPAAVEGVKSLEEKSAPSLIGSVEEYHRLVKEGVIMSKGTHNSEKPVSSNNSKQDDITQPKESERKIDAGVETKLDKVKEKKKKKPDKLERRKKSEKHKKNSNESCLEKCDLSNSTKDSVDRAQDGEIVEYKNTEVSTVSVPVQGKSESNDECTNEAVGGTVCASVEEKEELEEGEICQKEEGEISDSEDERKGSGNLNQLEQISCLKSTKIPNSRSTSASPFSSIPLPPVKQQSRKTPQRNSVAKRFILRHLQASKKKATNSKIKNKKKRKKGKKGAGGGNKKGLGFPSDVASTKIQTLPQLTKGPYEHLPNTSDFHTLASCASVQAVNSSQPPCLPIHPGLPQLKQISDAQTTNVNNSKTDQTYDSYYSWAYSQGLVSSCNGNYGYGTPEATPDPNVYKQWEEYYRKLMEACKVSAEHASAGRAHDFQPTALTEKSGYTWVFDHSTSATQPVQQSPDSTSPAVQVPTASSSSDVGETIPDVPPATHEMTEKERFESWQYRYGLKGLLKEHFIPAPGANPGDGNQK